MAIFFDLDGTLLDHCASQQGGLEALGSFSSHIRACLSGDFLRIWQESEARHFSRYEKGELTIEEQRRERLRECFPEVCGALDDEKLDNLYALYLDGYRASWTLYPEARDVLTQVSGPKALITNGDSKLQRAKVSQLQLEGFLDGIFISGELGVAKPHAGIFTKACENLSLAPDQVTYVGDNFRNDIEGAAGAGLSPIWINRDMTPRPLAQFSFREIASLTELITPQLPARR